MVLEDFPEPLCLRCVLAVDIKLVAGPKTAGNARKNLLQAARPKALHGGESQVEGRFPFRRRQRQGLDGRDGGKALKKEPGNFARLIRQKVVKNLLDAAN